jgi:hypothetical protein
VNHTNNVDWEQGEFWCVSRFWAMHPRYLQLLVVWGYALPCGCEAFPSRWSPLVRVSPAVALTIARDGVNVKIG